MRAPDTYRRAADLRLVPPGRAFRAIKNADRQAIGRRGRQSGLLCQPLVVMTVSTQGGAVYSIAYREFDGLGSRLGIRRRGGPDDPPETNKPMIADRWYRVNVLTPLPPEIGTHVSMVLDPIADDTDPVVRRSTLVMSTAGTL